MPNAHVLQPHVDRGHLAGAVTLVASPEAVLSLEAIGWADIAARAPMRIDSLFWIASTTKPFTSSLVAMLIEEGAVGLEDPVTRFIPEFKDMWVATEATDSRMVLERASAPITVKHLLTHTSGLPFNTKAEAGVIDRLDLRTAAISYAATPLQAHPGAKYSYSNAGVNTAGRIIEVASGMDYERFLAERLLMPLGMIDTCFRPNRAQLGRLAKAYAAKEGGPLTEVLIGQATYPLDAPTRMPSPAGGLFSTAADLARFGRMLLRGGELDGRRYLKPDSVRLLATNHTAQLKDVVHGLCMAVDLGSGTFGHGGALSNNLAIEPRQKLALIYLVQHQGYGGTEGASFWPSFEKSAQAAHGAAAGAAR